MKCNTKCKYANVKNNMCAYKMKYPASVNMIDIHYKNKLNKLLGIECKCFERVSNKVGEKNRYKNGLSYNNESKINSGTQKE